MCEFLSFAVAKEGALKIYGGESTISHSSIAMLNKIGEGDYCECEWTGEEKDTLTVRHTDKSKAAKLYEKIIKKYPTRKKILNDVIAAVNAVGGSLNLNGLTSAAGLTLPDSVGGDLYLRGLTSAAGLTLPDSVGGWLDLRGLTSAAGLTLPDSVGGSLNLSGLTSAAGLTLPDSVGGWLNLSGLTSAEIKKIPKKYQNKIIR